MADVLSGAALATAHNRNPKMALTAQIETDAEVIIQLIEALDTPEQANCHSRAQDRARLRLDAGRPENAPSRHPLHWPIAYPEVFNTPGRNPGFDAMVGNPPFIGGQKITGTAGQDIRDYLVCWIAGGVRGSADLVAYFFLKATKVSRSIGFLATNTIRQGATRKVGLTQIADAGWTIHRAVSSVQWPGEATVKISKVWATADMWLGQRTLDRQPEESIDETLHPGSRSGWRRRRLAANLDKSFQGSTVVGEGFIMSPEEAQELIARDIRNAEVLFPYLTGDDINHEPRLRAPRWIINFRDWTVNKAKEYPDCFKIVEDKVKPYRQERKPNGEFKRQRAAAEHYWLYHRASLRLYRAIDHLERVIAISRVGKTVLPAFVSKDQVFSDATIVFSYDDDLHFAVLVSGFHYRWALRCGSSLGDGPRYTTAAVFDTFPQPVASAAVASSGRSLNIFRSELMAGCQLGLTDIYNLVHDREVKSDKPIQRLRDLHVQLDCAVRDAYGWFDLDLQHGFHQVDQQGARFTFSPPVADEIFERLLELNRERYEEEVAKGLHDRKKAKASKRVARKQGVLLEKSK